MPGGSVAQAKRRSANDAGEAMEGGGLLDFMDQLPSEAELLAEISRKQTLNKTVPDKKVKYLDPIVREREDIIKAFTSNRASQGMSQGMHLHLGQHNK